MVLLAIIEGMDWDCVPQMSWTDVVMIKEKPRDAMIMESLGARRRGL